MINSQYSKNIGVVKKVKKSEGFEALTGAFQKRIADTLSSSEVSVNQHELDIFDDWFRAYWLHHGIVKKSNVADYLQMVRWIFSMEHSIKYKNPELPKIIQHLWKILGYIGDNYTEQNKDGTMSYTVNPVMSELSKTLLHGIDVLFDEGVVGDGSLKFFIDYAASPVAGNSNTFSTLMLLLSRLPKNKQGNMIREAIFEACGFYYNGKENFIKTYRSVLQSGFSSNPSIIGMLLWEWYQSMSDIDKESMDEYIEKNIFRLHELLSIKGPRFVAYLIRSYGITCFGRYTLESLLSLETIHEKNGIVLSAISDHNASIYELSEIHNRVIHTTNGTNMIPMEFTTLGDILIRLRNLRNMMKKHYGKFTPFKYLILQAHGNKKGISFGLNAKTRIPDELNFDHLGADIMVSRVSRFWREFFDPEGVVILVSCSSGSLDGGIAEELSKTLPNATIYASKEDAYLEDIIDQDGHLVPLFLAPDDGGNMTIAFKGGTILV